MVAAAQAWAEHYEENGVETKWRPFLHSWIAGERWLEDVPEVYEDPKAAAARRRTKKAPPSAATAPRKKGKPAPAGRQPPVDTKLMHSLVAVARDAAAAGRPFGNKTTSLEARRFELPAELQELDKKQLEKLRKEAFYADALLHAATTDGRWMRWWLDVPDGPFAAGKGQFAEGFPPKPGRPKGSTARARQERRRARSAPED